MYIFCMLMNSRRAPLRPDETLGYLLSDIVRLMTARFDARARAHGITRAQWSLVAALVRAEGASQAQLAEVLQVTPMAIGRLVDRMEKAGWVERRSEPGDRRAHRLYLTERAHAVRPRLRLLSASTEEEALAGLDEAERRSLVAELAGIRSRLAQLAPVERRAPRGRR